MRIKAVAWRVRYWEGVGRRGPGRFAALAMALGLLFFLAGLCATQAGPARAAAWAADERSMDPAGAGVRLVESGSHGVILEFLADPFPVQEVMLGGGACHAVMADGYGETDRSGWPRLPVRGVMVGIPPGGDATLTVLELDAAALGGRYRICPVPRPVAQLDASGRLLSSGVEITPDAEAYASDGLYPASPAELVSTGYIRGQRVAQVRFHPLQVNPVSGELRYNRRIRVRLDVGSPASPQAGDREVKPGPFEEVLRQVLVNYDTARQWRTGPRARAPLAIAAAQGSPACKVLVAADGIYEVSRSDLLAAVPGLGTVDPRTFRLHNQGQEVAIYVAGEEDGSFDVGDSILFYGQKVHTRYTDTNVYWLTWGGAAGRRMSIRDGSPGGGGSVPLAFPSTSHAEEDHIYNSKVPWGEDQDHWFWSYVFANGSAAQKTYPIAADEVASMPFSATVRGVLVGYESFPSADPDHHTRVYLNGHLVDDATWDGQIEYAFEADLPGSYLVEGTNLISVECPLDLGLPRDVVYINWFEIDYQRAYTAEGGYLRFQNRDPGLWEYRLDGLGSGEVEVFDITDPVSVNRLLGGMLDAGVYRFEDAIAGPTEYLVLTADRYRVPLEIVADVPSDLRSTDNGADYVVITHRDFYTDVLPLAARRANQGLRTLVVDVQDVYDEFNYGVFEPEAIHAFLAYAYANWIPPAPSYVLLVGDGSLDFKDRLGTGYRNWIPPYLAAVDPWINETATDNRYACVSGSDNLPDLFIGRLPVNSSAEASTVINKILSYEQSPAPGGWHEQVLFVADNADNAGDFAAFSDAIADQYLPPPYSAHKVYYKVTHSTVAEARTAIREAINDGRLLVNYVGHASYQWWATEGLLHVNDLSSLTNGQKLPMMVPMTCYDGFFHAPGIPSLGESIVRKSGGGAIASWSPTGVGLVMGHDYLNRGLYEAIFFDGVAEIGMATTLAKLYLYSRTSGYRDLLDTYLLFGDPALRLNLLPPYRLWLPLVARQATP